MRDVRDDRGSTLVIVALAMTALLSIVALAIDVGMLYTARGEAQRVADAAALAGAGSFIVAPDDGERARRTAVEYAARNDVRLENVALAPQDVEIDVAAHRVRVTVRRTTERGNAIATWFARIFGVNEVDVAAVATAMASPAGAATCMKPFAVPDAWDDTDEDGTYDPGEYYDPTETGYGSPWRDGEPSENEIDPAGTTYDQDLGRPVVLKEGTPEETIVASWYFPWDVPQVDGSPDVGADRYRWNIANCNTSTIYLGDGYMVENGNMTGPTKQGVQDLMDLDPNAEWDLAADSVVNSAYEPWEASPRVINLPLFDPTRKVYPGKKPIVFNNFTAFFLEGLRGSDVIGRFLFVSGLGVGTDGLGGQSVGPQVKYVHLVE